MWNYYLVKSGSSVLCRKESVLLQVLAMLIHCDYHGQSSQLKLLSLSMQTTQLRTSRPPRLRMDQGSMSACLFPKLLFL
jgi:hypothetical protein